MTLDSILHARVDPHSLGGGLIVAGDGLCDDPDCASCRIEVYP